MRESSDGVAFARWVAAFGLSQGRKSIGVDGQVSIPSQAWNSAFHNVGVERLTGLTVAAAEAGALALSEEQVEHLLQAHRDAMVWVLYVEQTLLAVAAALESAGVTTV